MKLTKTALTAALMLLTAPLSAATTITFDDLPGSDDYIPTGYKHFGWTDFGYLNSATYGYNPSGYQAATTSGKKVAYGGYNQTGSALTGPAPFQLVSFNMAAAWFDDLEVTVTGRLSGVDVFSQLLKPSASVATLYSFGGATIDELLFVSSFSAGSLHPGYAGCCYQFAIDDLVVDGLSVPEPAQWALMLSGFGLAGAALRRRRRVSVRYA